MAMKTDNMRYIVEVSKYKSINRAAQELFINQQQLSKIIHACETDLGTTIFKRTNKGISLTPDGEEIVDEFKKIIEIYDDLKKRQKKQTAKTGTLHILSEANIWSGYGWLIRGFAAEYPNISISVKNMSSRKIIEYLHDNDGVGLFFTTNKVLEEIDLGENLFLTPTTSGKIMVYADAKSPYLQKYKTLSLSTLSKLPLINYKPYSCQPTIMELIFSQNNIAPNIKYEVSDRQIFNDLLQKSGCMFFGLKRPSYIDRESIGEIRLRDNVLCTSGIVQKLNDPNPINKLFCDYYNTYCQSKY